MKATNEKGLTLLELLISIAILAMVVGAATLFTSTSINTQRQGTARSKLYLEGLLAMERMSSGLPAWR
ncbi:MAG: prepilin-type N-terminal cleavage/methylation domain-containing protein, partial [Desulforhopalus sp.]|nr:prepilin-type N-terminal cleavage/methylation domain-containing protein [Desulforhopalus sp.]